MKIAGYSLWAQVKSSDGGVAARIAMAVATLVVVGFFIVVLLVLRPLALDESAWGTSI